VIFCYFLFFGGFVWFLVTFKFNFVFRVSYVPKIIAWRASTVGWAQSGKGLYWGMRGQMNSALSPTPDPPNLMQRLMASGHKYTLPQKN
jgi:hypothetical protein